MPHPTSASTLDRSAWSQPWVQLKFVTFQPHIFPRMMGRVSADAKNGDLVAF
jgi:23S rRNA (cytosine1962-C5)-methyltransferase